MGGIGGSGASNAYSSLFRSLNQGVRAYSRHTREVNRNTRALQRNAQRANRARSQVRRLNLTFTQGVAAAAGFGVAVGAVVNQVAEYERSIIRVASSTTISLRDIEDQYATHLRNIRRATGASRAVSYTHLTLPTNREV